MAPRVFSALAALLLLAPPAAAGPGDISRPIGVVELFTSQGCNSCPPADELLGELASRGDVVALAYHVDYWDYLGWRDTMGSPENTARQREYAQSLGINSVYTPQAVVNGRHNINGADGEAVMRALRGGDLPVEVTVRREGDSVAIETGEAAGPVREAHIMIVYFDPPKQVRIGRGENGGRTITYWNAVTGFQAAGMWHGEAARFEMPLSEIMKKGAGGCAVLLQQSDENGIPGAIIGAAMIGKPVR
jgi:hypothetical protein